MGRQKPSSAASTPTLVLVGSRNPVKIAAVQEAFSRFFSLVQVKGVAVDSGVSHQPRGEETFRGALQRVEALAQYCREKEVEAQFLVGIEGGILQLYRRWFALGVMCIQDRTGLRAFGTSPSFELPEGLVQPLLSGKELGEVMDELTGESNTKQKWGAIGILTRGVMDRRQLYVQGLITALVPFLNRQLYFPTEQ